MAKLTGPLFSLAAKGKLANTLVYADWKGIDYARQYVIPSNPNTAAQQSQRSHFSTAVSQWHDTTYPLNAKDVENLNRAAGLESSPMSGFNYYVKGVTKTLANGSLDYQLYDTVEGTPSSGDMEIISKSEASNDAVAMRWGTTPRALINILDRDEQGTPGTTHTFNLTNLTPGVTYFYKLDNTLGSAFNDMGVGTFVAA